jgi:hypothetical protein
MAVSDLFVLDIIRRLQFSFADKHYNLVRFNSRSPSIPLAYSAAWSRPSSMNAIRLPDKLPLGKDKTTSNPPREHSSLTDRDHRRQDL